MCFYLIRNRYILAQFSDFLPHRPIMIDLYFLQSVVQNFIRTQRLKILCEVGEFLLRILDSGGLL